MTTWTEIGILWATAIVCLLLGRLGARMDARQDRADLARLRAELAAITARTMARTRARSDASRRGWVTRQGRGAAAQFLTACRKCGRYLDADGRCGNGCGTNKEETRCE
jgi:hypothetical protein